MSELQTDQVSYETAEPEQQADTGAELATDSGENHEQNQSNEKVKVEFSPEQQEIFDRAVKKQHSKFRDAERAQLDTQTQLQATQDQLNSLQANQPQTVIPDMPDSFDDDFESRVAARDQAIAEKARFDEHQNIALQAQRTAQNEAIHAQQVQALENEKTLIANSVKAGITEEDLTAASAIVGSYQLDQAVVQGLMTDKDGGLIISYLASNPLELDSLRGMDVYSQVNYLNNTVRSKASALRPQTSNAPDPAKQLSGAGAKEMEDPLLRGIQFD